MDLFDPNVGPAATGLLGAVLGWLFLRHLPAKDKQLREFIESRDRAFDAARREFTAALAELGRSHEKAVAETGRHCREEVERILAVFTEHRRRPATPGPPRP
jgi:hypothetical protein